LLAAVTGQQVQMGTQAATGWFQPLGSIMQCNTPGFQSG
jgi:hypothetical protein